MEILLDPNIAYLVLVGAWVLILLAVITPGTGMLEVGALFLSGLAAWELYSQPVNGWALLALGLGAIPFVLSLRYPRRRVYLGAALVLFMVGSCFIFPGQAWWQPAVNPLLALGVSLAAGGYVWFATHKALEATKALPSHSLELLIGQVGEAKSPIQESGSAQVAGELWSARSQRPIAAGQRLKVIGREGFTLIVEPLF